MMHQYWYTYIFMALFIAAFFGLYIYSRLAMFANIMYNLALLSLWGFLIVWNWQ